MDDEINSCRIRTQSLKEKRNVLHEKLGSIKSMTTFLMEATTFWEIVGCLSDNASLKSDQLEKIMSIASKKNTLKILTSGGTKTLMGSFKERWLEIEDMMRSDNIVFAMEKLDEHYPRSSLEWFMDHCTTVHEWIEFYLFEEFLPVFALLLFILLFIDIVFPCSFSRFFVIILFISYFFYCRLW